MSDEPLTDESSVSAETRLKMQLGFEKGDVIATRYRVETLLGRGGMGLVYRVKDLKTKGRLALKTLLPKYASNKRAIGRFVREVNTVRRLNHPGIVKILDARQYGPMLYYTMEYLDGISLREYMKKRRRLGLGSTMRILTLLCEALDHAHEVTIHRDVSPENIMLLGDATIKLLDFGLAKLELPDDPCFTMVGASLGKARYKAPEQHTNAADVDTRADIYPLGVMFFEMLTGKLPKLDQSILDLRPELPPQCDGLLAKSLATDPSDRYATVGEFQRDLLEIYNISKGGRTRKQTSKPGPREAVQAPMAAAFPSPYRRRTWLERLSERLAGWFRR